MRDSRPVNLALHTISLPVSALASITHRISGVLLFAGSGVLIGALACAVQGPEQYEQVRVSLSVFWVRALLSLFVLSWLYHTLAGVRHLAMDLGWGESAAAGRVSAILVFLLVVLTAVPLLQWLWS